jgi:hypothetical protein
MFDIRHQLHLRAVSDWNTQMKVDEPISQALFYQYIFDW